MVDHLSRSNLINPKGPSTPHDGCVCAQFNKSHHWLPRSAPEIKFGQTDGRLDQRPVADIRGDAITPRPYFVGRGIK